MAMAYRDSLAPQPGDGLRVRGEITQVVEKQPNRLEVHGATIHAGIGKFFRVFLVFRGGEMQIERASWHT